MNTPLWEGPPRYGKEHPAMGSLPRWTSFAGEVVCFVTAEQAEFLAIRLYADPAVRTCFYPHYTWVHGRNCRGTYTNHPLHPFFPGMFRHGVPANI